jgi:methylmalonyl-CoA mutase N-terminal domain/subunit
VAGSYAIEAMTTGIEQEVAAYFERIEALGGMLAAIERGWVQQEIQNAAYATQRAIDSGEATVVGVNRFTRETEPGIPTQRIDEALERKQVERLRALRAKRDAAQWQGSLDRVRDAARSGANLMPAILDAAESYATVGEIATTLRDTFGEYQESVRL